jgi:hypothetical protein
VKETGTIAMKLEHGGCEKKSPSPSNSDGSGEGGGLKGLMRLRAKAPPPIDMSLINKALQLEKESFDTTTTTTTTTTTIFDSSFAESTTDSSSEVDQARIDVELGTSERPSIPNAPMIPNVPLPPVTPGPTVATALGLGRPRLQFSNISWPAELLALVIPDRRLPKMPITPRRQSLLDILNRNRDSTVHGTVARREIRI